jgi:hypothetical protein
VERAVTGADPRAMVRDARARWDALLARDPRERMAEPGRPGGWSVEDAVADATDIAAWLEGRRAD